MSLDSIDLKNATDQEDHCIHTDSDDVPTSASRVTPPSSPPSPAISSSSTDPSGPAFSFSLQSHARTNHPDSEGWTAPEQHYTRKHHERLNGKY